MGTVLNFRVALFGFRLPIVCLPILYVALSGCGAKDAGSGAIAKKKSSNSDGQRQVAGEAGAPKGDKSKKPVEPSQQWLAAKYVDDALCADCHHDIWDTYQDVAMSKSAYPFDVRTAIENFDEGHFFHKESNKHYEMKLEGGNMVMARYRLRDDGTRADELRRKVDWVIGSGHHSRTYAYRDETGHLFEFPVSWYSQEQKWAMSPGFDHAQHQDFGRPITRECMFCHNAYPSFTSGDDQFGMPDRFPEKLPHGIGCQRCHGPGSEHVRTAELAAESTDKIGAIVNPAKLDAQAQEDVCNQCHFQPSSSRTSFMRHPHRGVYSFLPGQKLANYQSYVELADAAAKDVFEVNHHAYRMYQSVCYIESSGKMNCTTCHDPHAAVVAEDRPRFYRQKCFQCHHSTDCRDVELGQKEDANCVSCHMPTRRPEDAVHLTVTDHKIVAQPEGDLVAPRREYKLSGSHPVKDYQWFRPEARPSTQMQITGQRLARLRDQDQDAARQLVRQVRSGQGSTDQTKIEIGQVLLELGQPGNAIAIMRSVSPSRQKSSLVQSNLGLAHIQMQRLDFAKQHLDAAIAQQPVIPEAHVNMAVYYMNVRKPGEAIKQLSAALKLKPNLTQAWLMAAKIHQLNRDWKQAQAAYQEALRFDPDQIDARVSLAMVQQQLNSYPTAIQTLKDGLLSVGNKTELLNQLTITTLEAVDAEQLEAESGLEMLKQLIQPKKTFTRPVAARNGTLLAIAYLQNQNPAKAREMAGTLNGKESQVDRELIEAIVKHQSGESTLTQADQNEIKKRLEAAPQRTRHRSLLVKMFNRCLQP